MVRVTRSILRRGRPQAAATRSATMRAMATPSACPMAWTFNPWSRADNAWAVDDGTSQTFYLDATGNWAGNQFSQFNQTYALTLNGDQNGSPTDDTVTIGQVGIGVQKGGVQVTQNGETVTFDKGQITNITINMKDGNDTINVENA